MDDKLASALISTLISAPLGAICGGLGSYFVSSLIYERFPRKRRKNLRKALRIVPIPPHGQDARCVVFNGGDFTMEQVIAYLDVDYAIADLVEPPAGTRPATIIPTASIPHDEQLICWSIMSDSSDPFRTDLFAHQRHGLTPFRIHANCIEVPSELGWGDNRLARCYLKRKQYVGILKIVSRDIDSKEYRVQLDPDDPHEPFKVIGEA